MSDQSARSMFSIPRGVCYLNAAYMTPCLNGVADACRAGVQRRRVPWQITAADFFDEAELLRSLFATLLGCRADNVAIVPAASYGIACAARNISVKPKQKILLLADQFPSNYYAWQRLAAAGGAGLCVVATPPDLDWTAAVLEAVALHKDAIAVAALPNHHWSNGAALHLEIICAALREIGARIVLDVSQTLGACPFDLTGIRPDYLVAAGYKWLFCPYGISFLYVAERHFDGIPLEETWTGRRGSEDFARLADYSADYEAGARRFDVGERAQFEVLPGAIAAIRQVLDWGVDRISHELDRKNTALAALFRKHEFGTLDRALRGPHFQGVRVPDAMVGPMADALRATNVYVSQRGESLRIAPHLYNDEEDLHTLETALDEIIHKA